MGLGAIISLPEGPVRWEFPVFSLLNREIPVETGSHQTAPSASKSLRLRNLRPAGTNGSLAIERVAPSELSDLQDFGRSLSIGRGRHSQFSIVIIAGGGWNAG